MSDHPQPADEPAIQPADQPADEPAIQPAIDVAVNLLWCVPGQVGGSEQYLVRQLLGLTSQPADRRPPFDTTLYCLPSFVDAHPELARRHAMVAAPISGERRVRRIVGEHTWLRRHTADAQLVHHGGGTAPMIGRRPIVLTIHDLQYRTHPEYLTPRKRRYLAWTIPQSVRRAAVVAVPTDYVRSTVIDAYGTDPDRVLVVPHGVEASLGADAPTPDDLRAVYGLGTGPVIVFPAITHPHKNHRFLLELMAHHWTDPDLRSCCSAAAGAAESRRHRRHRSARRRATGSSGRDGCPTPS
jgi:hypothetical protein